MFQSRRRNNLPGWLWFFLILPMVLVVALLYRRRRLPQLNLPRMPRLPSVPGLGEHGVQRYVEPDSIPLDMSDARPVSYEQEPARPLDTRVEPVGTVDTEFPVPAAPETEAVQAAVTQPAPETAAAEGPADDLKIIEGIGPAIERILQESGIRSFRQLANASTEQLVEILTPARLNRITDPGTWPEQARLAAEGRWEDLSALQNSLKAGRRPKTE